ncbi:hypothetical protein F9L07_28505 [Pimelobacter simplex]|uniref:Uncharacterized protein n=1 Tax=Nocardioides simplex TaxID=2045 RepID=A0A7J5DQY6_NOCSI|nr:hypothetical protein [Pimelobacter simplex]KAB2806977.1 hypothetical protein F9L07_28505 [Pimelobacter simplex]
MPETPIDRAEPAYQYGRMLGTFQRGILEFARLVQAGFDEGRYGRRVIELSVQEREHIAEEAHRRRLAAERRQGLQYVDRYAAKVRADLGLPR